MSSENNRHTESIKYIFIKHIDDEKIWPVAETSLISELLKKNTPHNSVPETYGMSSENPIIVKDIKAYTIPLIISYIKFYDGKIEKQAPENPIKNIHLSTIFGSEYCLFADICDVSPDKPITDKILEINEYIKSATYFGLDNLQKKLCAIIAAIFKNMSLSEIKKLLDE